LRAAGFAFRAAGFAFRAAGFAFRAAGFAFRAAGFAFRAAGVGFFFGFAMQLSPRGGGSSGADARLSQKWTSSTMVFGRGSL
jgi:hypothetical protein